MWHRRGENDKMKEWTGVYLADNSNTKNNNSFLSQPNVQTYNMMMELYARFNEEAGLLKYFSGLTVFEDCRGSEEEQEEQEKEEQEEEEEEEEHEQEKEGNKEYTSNSCARTRTNLIFTRSYADSSFFSVSLLNFFLFIFSFRHEGKRHCP